MTIKLEMWEILFVLELNISDFSSTKLRILNFQSVISLRKLFKRNQDRLELHGCWRCTFETNYFDILSCCCTKNINIRNCKINIRRLSNKSCHKSQSYHCSFFVLICNGKISRKATNCLIFPIQKSISKQFFYLCFYLWTLFFQRKKVFPIKLKGQSLSWNLFLLYNSNVER